MGHENRVHVLWLDAYGRQLIQQLPTQVREESLVRIGPDAGVDQQRAAAGPHEAAAERHDQGLGVGVGARMASLVEGPLLGADPREELGQLHWSCSIR